jgi:hypothetical protein
MAIHARNLVEKNGLSGVIEVIQSSVEDLQLPCKVDIIGTFTIKYISHFTITLYPFFACAVLTSSFPFSLPLLLP